MNGPALGYTHKLDGVKSANKRKNKTIPHYRNSPKSNRKIVEVEVKSISITNINVHDTAHIPGLVLILQ